MASPPDGQRIERELSKRGTCSFLDLKSSLKLSRGDIHAYTERLAHRGLVMIKKDHRGYHTFYAWTGAKEEAMRPEPARLENVLPPIEIIPYSQGGLTVNTPSKKPVTKLEVW